jgi:hypothetical protein
MGKTYKSDKDSYFDDGFADAHRYYTDKAKERRIKEYQENKKLDKRDTDVPDVIENNNDWDDSGR